MTYHGHISLRTHYQGTIFLTLRAILMTNHFSSSFLIILSYFFLLGFFKVGIFSGDPLEVEAL